MLTEQHNIRDVIMFPMMKDEQSSEQQHTPKDLKAPSSPSSIPSPEKLP
jgi:aspartyl-tRNA synthetase